MGLNDPTPVAPVGGNPYTTLGNQRIFVYLVAADLWGSVLDSPEPVYVGASFAALSCTPTAGTLGSAGTTFVFRDFPGAPEPGTWYHSPLADAIAGTDLQPGYIDINSRFNSRIGTDPGCLTGANWYYGIDHNEGTRLRLPQRRRARDRSRPGLLELRRRGERLLPRRLYRRLRQPHLRRHHRQDLGE